MWHYSLPLCKHTCFYATLCILNLWKLRFFFLIGIFLNCKDTVMDPLHICELVWILFEVCFKMIYVNVVTVWHFKCWKAFKNLLCSFSAYFFPNTVGTLSVSASCLFVTINVNTQAYLGSGSDSFYLSSHLNDWVH